MSRDDRDLSIKVECVTVNLWTSVTPDGQGVGRGTLLQADPFRKG